MANKSKIEWLARNGTVPATWNPVRATNVETGKVGWFCIPASPGCLRCYAARWNIARGNGLDFLVVNEAKVKIWLDDKMLTQPLRWTTPHTIFPCSMTDLFGDFVPDKWIYKMLAVMSLTPQHTYIVTTKRPERMRALLTAKDAALHIMRAEFDLADPCYPNGRSHTDEEFINLKSLPLPNVWLGVSVCNGGPIDLRFMDALVETPAALRWVSFEPAIGRFNLSPWMHRLGWVVFGGESGSKRPCNLDWAAETMRVCSFFDVPVFIKQLGRRPIYRDEALKLKHVKGADMAEWPKELRVREFPE